MKPLKPYAGSEKPWRVYVQWQDPVWVAIERGWQCGWTLREIAQSLELSLYTIEQRVHAWLERRP